MGTCYKDTGMNSKELWMAKSEMVWEKIYSNDNPGIKEITISPSLHKNTWINK